MLDESNKEKVVFLNMTFRNGLSHLLENIYRSTAILSCIFQTSSLPTLTEQSSMSHVKGSDIGFEIPLPSILFYSSNI